jgi:hypothetical protein
VVTPFWSFFLSSMVEIPEEYSVISPRFAAISAIRFLSRGSLLTTISLTGPTAKAEVTRKYKLPPSRTISLKGLPSRMALL